MDLRAFRFCSGPVSLELLAAPDLEVLAAAAQDADRLPYWAVLWESAPALGGWLAGQECLAGARVLELGCGPGLAGLVAAARGACVLQTDRFPEAARLARRNARRNALRGVRHVTADWRAWPLRGSWPLVIGSDVTYERAAHGPLLQVLEQCLAPGGVACLADPDRPMSLAFLARAEGAGWRVEIHPAPPAPVTVAGESGFGPGRGEIFLHTLRRA